MINKNFKKFIKALKEINLSEKEKSLLRYRISEFITYNPIRKEIDVKKKSFYFSIFTLRTLSKGVAFVLVVLTVVGGTGVSYASTSALPGDRLYSVKVNVTERIEETLAVSQSAKINVHSTHVERRLNEAQKLVQEDRLSTENKEIVRANLERNVQNVTKTIENLKNDGQIEKALEVAARVTPVLGAHKQVLTEKSLVKKEDAVAPLPEQKIEVKNENMIALSLTQNEEDVITEEIEGVAMMSNIETKEEPKKEESTIDSLLNTVSLAISQIEKIEDQIIEKILENEKNTETITESNQNSADQKINEMRRVKIENKEIEKSAPSQEKTMEGETKITLPKNEAEINLSIATEQEKEALEEIKSQDDFEEKIKEVEEILKLAREERLAGNIRTAFILSYKARKITDQIKIYQTIKLTQTTAEKKDVAGVKIDEKIIESKEAAPQKEGVVTSPEVTEENKIDLEISEILEEIKEIENIEQITEKDVIESIENVSDALKKINQANLEVQNRL